MVCPVCGKEIEKTTWNKKYCSKKCNNKANNGKKRKPSQPMEIATCQLCGKEFERNVASRKYCSDECARLAALEKMREARHSENYATCPICGNRFKKKGASRFCSDECRNAYYDKTPVRKVCICCGKTFIPKRSNVIFCSDECRHHRKEALENPKFTSYEAGKSISDIAKKAKMAGMSYGKYVEAMERGII